MSAKQKSIASPKRGKAVGHLAKRNSATGHFMDVKIHKQSKHENPHLVSTVTGVRSKNRAKMLTVIKKGINFTAIGRLEEAFHTSQKEVAKLLSIPPSTLTRRKKDGQLNTEESDRVVRFAHLKDNADELMGGDDAAITWLRTPLEILGGETPLERARTELGFRDVEDLIGRLKHGVFS